MQVQQPRQIRSSTSDAIGQRHPDSSRGGVRDQSVVSSFLVQTSTAESLGAPSPETGPALLQGFGTTGDRPNGAGLSGPAVTNIGESILTAESDVVERPGAVPDGAPEKSFAADPRRADTAIPATFGGLGSTTTGVPPRDKVIDIEITCNSSCYEEPHDPYAHNFESHRDETQRGTDGRPQFVLQDPAARRQGMPVAQPEVTVGERPHSSAGTVRATIPSLESSPVSRLTLAFEAAPGWIRKLPGPMVAAAALAWYNINRPAGDIRVFEFPIADDARVVLDGTLTDPGHVEIDGRDTGILVNPVRDDDGQISGFAPDSYYDQHELHRLTGAWVALSENASGGDDTPIVVVGAGSVRGRGKPPIGDAENRRSIRSENKTGVLIAGEEGRNLERVQDPRRGEDSSVSRPDYIDLDTGDRIEVYSPKGSLKRIKSTVTKKMTRDQGDIIVVNIGDNDLPVAEVVNALEEESRDRPVTVIDQEGVFHYLEPNVDRLAPRDES